MKKILTVAIQKKKETFRFLFFYFYYKYLFISYIVRNDVKKGIRKIDTYSRQTTI